MTVSSLPHPLGLASSTIDKLNETLGHLEEVTVRDMGSESHIEGERRVRTNDLSGWKNLERVVDWLASGLTDNFQENPANLDFEGELVVEC